MIKAIFFDFNGVIIDDEAIQMKAYQEVLRGHQIELTQEWYLDALGTDDKTYIVRSGDKLADGTIRAITSQMMLINQEIKDPLSRQKEREVRKMLRQLDGTN